MLLQIDEALADYGEQHKNTFTQDLPKLQMVSLSDTSRYSGSKRLGRKSSQVCGTGLLAKHALRGQKKRISSRLMT